VVRANYTSDTLLTGWDNVHSEFNLGLAFKRSVHAVWQEYQGLGLVGGMAHAAELPRILLLGVMSFFLSMESLRYAWMFFMLLLGPIGVYFLFRQLTAEKQSLAGVTAAVFYLFNLVTVQYFYVPLETFASLYGFAPWLLWALVRYWQQPSRRSALLLLLIGFIGSSAFYVQTLFIAFMVFAGIFAVEQFLRSDTKGKRAVVVGLALFVTSQLYWLLPAGYFSLNHGSKVGEAKINAIASPETVWMNRAYGNVKDVILLRGFWLSYTDGPATTIGPFEYLMAEWRELSLTAENEFLGYGLFVVAVLGWLSRTQKRKKWGMSGVILVIVSFGLLTAGNGWLGIGFRMLGAVVPLFEESFRTVFTKWSLFWMLMLALGTGWACLWVSERFSKGIGRVLPLGLTAVIIGASIYQVRPIFEGALFREPVKQAFPNYYNELFTFFGSQPKQHRIVLLPMTNFWGWNYYSWGYRGSGFLWYGIEQPILDRNFDVWSPVNESAYQEMKRGIELQDIGRVMQVWEKYDISYVLLDESLIKAGGQDDVRQIEFITDLAERTGMGRVFQTGPLTVWMLPEDVINPDFVYAPESYSTVYGLDSLVREDVVYSSQGVNITRPVGDSFYYPFSGLMREELKEIRYIDNVVEVERDLEREGTLVVPGMEVGGSVNLSGTVSMVGDVVRVEFESLLSLSVDGNLVANFRLPTAEIQLGGYMSQAWVSVNGTGVEVIDGQTASLSVSSVVGEAIEIRVYGGDEEVMPTSLFQVPANKCWVRSGFEGMMNDELLGEVRKVSVADASACLTMRLGEPQIERGLMKVEQRYRSENMGKPHFCVDIEGGEYRCEHEDVFFQTPASDDWATVSRYVEVMKGNIYWLDVIARPSDKVGQSWTLFYENPRVNVRPLLIETVLTSDVWRSVLSGQEVVISEGNKLTASWTTKPMPVDFALAGNVEVQNCDLFKRGVVEKVGTTFRAKDRGAACDLVSLPYLSFDQEYVLRWQGENTSGRSLKFYLFNNHSQRNDLEILLNTKRFDQSFGVLSWPGFNDLGYMLSLENRSFGREVSENIIESVAFYPAPLSWLSHIRIEPVGELEKLPNSLEILKVKKFGTSYYRVQIVGEGLLALSQGYEKGWVAVPMNNFQFSIFNFQIPNLFKTYEHVKVNGWSNGFLVASDQLSETSNIVIVYWPQYLQWVGLGLLGITLGIILFKKGKRH
jgi:hypothetical protein